MAKAKAVLDSYRIIKALNLLHLDNRLTMKQQQWNPPPPGWLKINVDAATNMERMLAGLGAVVRDSNRDLITAAVKTSTFHGDVIFAESEAVTVSKKC